MTGTSGTPELTGTDPDVSLTTAAAADLVGVTPRTIRRWIEKARSLLLLAPAACSMSSHKRSARSPCQPDTDSRDVPCAPASRRS